MFKRLQLSIRGKRGHTNFGSTVIFFTTIQYFTYLLYLTGDRWIFVFHIRGRHTFVRLRNSEYRFRLISGKKIYFVNNDVVYCTCNKIIEIELIGNRFVDYLHADDAILFNQMLEESKKLSSQFYQKSFSARIKSSLVKRATKDTYESAVGFKVRTVASPKQSYTKIQYVQSLQALEVHIAPRLQNTVDGWPICIGFAGLAAPLPSTTMPECRLDNWTFVITTLLDFKLQYIDTK